MTNRKKFLVILGISAVLLTSFSLIFIIDGGFESKGKTPGEIRVTKGYKLTEDSQKTFTVEVPDSWEVETRAYNDFDNSVTTITAKTEDYEMSAPNEMPETVVPSTLKKGAKIDVTVSKGVLDQSNLPEGEIISQGQVKVIGINADYFIRKDPSLMNSQVVDSLVNYGGNLYLFRLTYNKDTFKDGESVFKHVAESFKIVNRQ